MPILDVEIIIMMGIYELNFNKSSKDYAVYSQYLNLLDILKLSKFKSLLNGVLAKFPKELDLTNISKMFPKFFVDELIGLDKNKYLLNTLEKPKLSFIINDTKDKTASEIKELIGKDNFKTFLNNDYYYSEKTDLLKENFLSSGYIYIQDLASQFVSDLIVYDDKIKVLDLCSAPGGKTINTAIKLLKHKNKNSIVSVEKSKSRFEILEGNIKTLGLLNINLKNEDIFELNYNEEFDYIIVDPPCSALGTYKRHPEVLLQKNNVSSNFSKLQLEILLKVKKFLKPGGKIIYSVCTFTKSETTDLVKEFLKNEEFHQVQLPDFFDIFNNSFFINTASYNELMDTHFITVLEKNKWA